jgi:hypothetical protein
VATHNHFALDRGGKVFNRSAPIIKLPAESTEYDHLELLGLLNSSTACFWMKQSFQTKGSSGMGRGVYDERWEFFFEHTTGGLEPFPVPERKPVDLTRQVDILGQKYTSLLPETTFLAFPPSAAALDEAKAKANAVRGQMIGLQEELDWNCYQL